MSHIAVMPVNGVLTYDFRFQDSYNEDPFGFGLVGQKELLPTYPGKWAMHAGNGDQIKTEFDSENDRKDINLNDRTYWEGQNGTIGQYRNGDYNMNADCNFNDRITYEFNNGAFSAVPTE
jgi:hypothetical protein